MDSPHHRQIHNAFQTAVALAEWENRTNAARDKTTKGLVLGKKQFKQVAEVSQGFDQYMTDLMGGRNESDLAANNQIRHDFQLSKMMKDRKEYKGKKRKEESESETEGSDTSDEDSKVAAKRTKDSDDSDVTEDSDERKTATAKNQTKRKGTDSDSS
jgi:hypothetical protein